MKTKAKKFFFFLLWPLLGAICTTGMFILWNIDEGEPAFGWWQVSVSMGALFGVVFWIAIRLTKHILPLILFAISFPVSGQDLPGFYGVTSLDKTQAWIIHVQADTVRVINEKTGEKYTDIFFSRDTLSIINFPGEYASYLFKKEIGNKPKEVSSFVEYNEDEMSYRFFFHSDDWVTWTSFLHGKKACKKYNRIYQKLKRNS